MYVLYIYIYRVEREREGERKKRGPVTVAPLIMHAACPAYTYIH
jgi:hypothetical protein